MAKVRSFFSGSSERSTPVMTASSMSTLMVPSASFQSRVMVTTTTRPSERKEKNSTSLRLMSESIQEKIFSPSSAPAL